MKTILKAVCDDAFISQTGKLNVIGIFEKVIAPQFPALHPKLCFVFSLDNEKGKAEELTYSFDISDEDNKKIFDMAVNPMVMRFGNDGKANLTANVQLLSFPKKGRYTATFDFSGHRESIEFEVEPS